MKTRVIGLDPGLRRTGWGVIEVEGSSLAFLASGTVGTDNMLPLASRLSQIFEGLLKVISKFSPNTAAVEETFVNRNPKSTLKLGQARGVVLLAPAYSGVPVAEYSATVIKKSIVGAGHAHKDQVQAMIKVLLPRARPNTIDEADALAVAVCHVHHSERQELNFSRKRPL
tara:strand:- start:36 stop:545 length:510 start_codon:yes stop_codon:yes gene_type:complete